MASAWGKSFGKAWGNSFGSIGTNATVHVVGFEAISYFNNPQVDYWRLNSPHGTAVNKFFRPIVYAKTSVIGEATSTAIGIVKTYVINTNQAASARVIGCVSQSSAGIVKISSGAKAGLTSISSKSQFNAFRARASATVSIELGKTLSRAGITRVVAHASVQVQTKPSSSKLGYAFARGIQNPTEAELLAIMAYMRNKRGTSVTKSKPFNYAPVKKPVPDEALVALARFLR